MNVPGMLSASVLQDWLGSVLAGWLAAPPPRLEWDFRLLINSLYIIGFLLAGAILIAFVNRWRLGASQDAPTPGDQLAHFRSLYTEGKISQEEFDRLRSLLAGRIRAEVGVPAKPAVPTDNRSIAEPPRSPDPTKPQNPPSSSDPPETGIRPV